MLLLGLVFGGLLAGLGYAAGAAIWTGIGVLLLVVGSVFLLFLVLMLTLKEIQAFVKKFDTAVRAKAFELKDARKEAVSPGSTGGISLFQLLAASDDPAVARQGAKALAMLTSDRLANALNLDKEDPKLRERYGRGSAKKQADGSHKLLDDFLMARRLVSAGARCVSLAFSRWDWHGGNFNRARQDMPMLDQGLTALVEDLHNRGMEKDVSVVGWGEFGRTPKINKNA